MDAQKTGAFIAERRRDLGLTQKKLAQRLHLSNKTVSKWETGHGLPDIDVVMALAETLGVSVADILTGGADRQKSLAVWTAHEQQRRRRKKTLHRLIYATAGLAAAGAMGFFTAAAEQGNDRLALMGAICLGYLILFALVCCLTPGISEITLPVRPHTGQARGIVLWRDTWVNAGSYGSVVYPYIVVRTETDQKLRLTTSWEAYDQLFPGDRLELSWGDKRLRDYTLVERGPLYEFYYASQTEQAVFLENRVQPAGQRAGRLFRLALFRTASGETVELRVPEDFPIPRGGTKGRLSWHYCTLDDFTPEEA